MKGKSHSPEQIVSKLREVDRLQAEEGLSIAAAAKRVEISEGRSTADGNSSPA